MTTTAVYQQNFKVLQVSVSAEKIEESCTAAHDDGGSLIGICRGFGGGADTYVVAACERVVFFSWQPDNPFAKKATVCCIGFFVRRWSQLLLPVFSILSSCLLLLCTQRMSSNLFVAVIRSSSVRSTLSARTFVQLKCFVLLPLFCQSVVCLFPLPKKLSFVMVPLFGYFAISSTSFFLSCTQGPIFAVGNCNCFSVG